MAANETKYDGILNEQGRYNLLQFSDGILHSADGWTFNVHRIILVRTNEYFRTMFCGSKERSEFTIPGITGKCLREILHYLYDEKISITEENAAEIIEAADYLLIADLLMKVKEGFERTITLSNCLQIFQVAHRINDSDICRITYRFIETRFQRIMSTQINDVVKLPLEILIEILNSRSLYVYSETTVWEAIAKWIDEDISTRSCYALQLLVTLARGEVDETLASEILQYEIVANNDSLKRLHGLSHSTSNVNKLIHLLENISIHLDRETPHLYRIPAYVNVIVSHFEAYDQEGSRLLITYDENFDLWREIAVLDFQPEFITAVGHNVYLFVFDITPCRKFDLITYQWVPMTIFRNPYEGFRIAAIDKYIYIIGYVFMNFNTWELKVEIYDTVNDMWFDGYSLDSIYEVCCATINKKFYLIGNTANLDGMVAKEFDTVTHTWSDLSEPIVFRTQFAMVAFHGKVYLIGGSDEDGKIRNAECFDPETRQWTGLPNLPFVFEWTDVIVFNDQIYVYDGFYDDEHENKNIVRWNEVERRWEELEATSLLRDIHHHRISTVDDINALRMVTAGNRDRNIHFEKINLYK